MANREKVEFAANIPTQVVIDGAGTKQPSKDGTTEYRYFLQGEKIMWVPESVHFAMQNAGGNQFVIERQKRGNSDATWCVEAPPLPAAPRRAPAASSRRPESAPRFQQAEEAECNASDRLAGAFAAAIDCALEAEQYGRRKGLKLEFSANDIRAMAATLYIEQSKAGRA